MSGQIFRPAVPCDIEDVLRLLREAQAWHRAMRVSPWPDFSRAMVANNVAASNVFVLEHEGRTVATATIVEEDPLVWKDGRPSLYLHRLATTREMKGKGLCARMVAELDTEGQRRQKEALRLDCWADNEKLKSFYVSLGFTWVSDVFIAKDPSLPAHYWNSTTSLFERAIAPFGVTGDILVRSKSAMLEGADDE